MGGGEDKGDISCLVDIDVGDMLVVGGIGPRGSNRPPMGHLGGRGIVATAAIQPSLRPVQKTWPAMMAMAVWDIMRQQIYLIWKEEHRP